MIETDRATLAIYSDSRTVAEVTASIQLEPTEAADIGEATRAARAGRDLKPEYLTYRRTTWVLEVDGDLVDSDGEYSGVSALSELVRILLPALTSLEALRRDCETVIWWSGDANNSQGSFVFPAALIKDLAATGCEIRGTVYLDDYLS